MLKKRGKLSKKQVIILCISLTIILVLFTVFIFYLHSLIPKDQSGTFGDTLITSDFEYIFHKDYIGSVSDNGDLIIIVPVTINNIGYSLGVSSRDISIYNPNGTKITGGRSNGYTVANFGYDGDSGFDSPKYNGTGEIRRGGKTETTLCFLYEGDGEYCIELNSGTSGQTVRAFLKIEYR